MPFYGQDWRMPGDQWVKTTEGWERLQMWRVKLMENLNENLIARLLKLTSDYMDLLNIQTSSPGTQPHVLIIRNSAQEQRKIHTSLGDALNKLDISGALRDSRRFNYASKLLEILISEHLYHLSGSAQKIVFNLLEVMVIQACKTSNNLHEARALLNAAHDALHSDCRWTNSNLWQKHCQALAALQDKLAGVKLTERTDNGLTLTDLPPECIREILVRLPDGRDLARAGLTEQRSHSLSDDSLLWRDLCLFHFTDRQVVSVVRKGETVMDLGWKGLYIRLHKRYGLRETYAEILHLCRNCNALYWKGHGHPCLVSNVAPHSVPVSPAMCVQVLPL